MKKSEKKIIFWKIIFKRFRNNEEEKKNTHFQYNFFLNFEHAKINLKTIIHFRVHVQNKKIIVIKLN